MCVTRTSECSALPIGRACRVSDILDFVKIDKAASHVLISGFDRLPDCLHVIFAGCELDIHRGRTEVIKSFFRHAR